ASGRTTSWTGSNSFFAAESASPAPFPVGGAASRSTLSIVVAVHSVAPAGDGRANVVSPVGVQSVHCDPAPDPPDPLDPVGPLDPPPEQAANASAARRAHA